MQQHAEEQTSNATVLKREDAQTGWRHYFVVTEATTTHVEMVRAAISGWNLRRVETHPIEDGWPDMTAASVVAWKIREHGSTRCDAQESTRVLALLARWERGEPGGATRPVSWT